MIGGTVIETIVQERRVWINVKDEDSPDSTCGIYVENTPQARSISERDTIWWQAGWAMWTPRERLGGRPLVKGEITLKRVGFSGAKRPGNAQEVGGSQELQQEEQTPLI